jgi:hypothetical protein
MGIVALCVVVLSSCYSFKGTTISPDVKTFYIASFRNTASNAPAEIGQLFSDKLRDKVLRESRLAYSEQDISVEFEGAVTSYSVTSVAPTNNAATGVVGSSLNRLQITVQVSYLNNVTDEDTWSQSFSFFQDFDSNEDLVSVQDDLIDAIFEQITEDVFNRAFTNW